MADRRWVAPDSALVAMQDKRRSGQWPTEKDFAVTVDTFVG